MRIFAERTLLEGSDLPCPALITIQGRDILGVTPHPSREEAASADTSFGARYLAAPAFVNGHTHLALSALRGVGGLAALRGNVVEDLYFWLEGHLEAADVRAFSRIGAFECLLTGTGLVWDHYYYGRAVVEAVAEVGLCAVVAPTLQDEGGPGVAMREAHWEETLAIDADPALQALGIGAALGPHATDTVSDALWLRVAEQARASALPIHAHLAQSPEEVRRSRERHGCLPLARLRRLGVLSAGVPALLAHGLYVPPEERAPRPGESMVLASCPASQAQFDFPASAEAWRAAGVPVVLGTDAGCCNDSMDIQAELRLAALGPRFALAHHPALSGALSDADLGAFAAERRRHHDARPSLAELLAMAGAGPGALHPRLQAGRIAPGCLANLAVYDLHHPAMWPGLDPARALALGRCAGALHAMMTAGRWQGTPGNFHQSLLGSEAYRQSVAEASSRLDALLRRAGYTPSA